MDLEKERGSGKELLVISLEGHAHTSSILGIVFHLQPWFCSVVTGIEQSSLPCRKTDCQPSLWAGFG